MASPTTAAASHALRFSQFDVTRQAFFRSKLSMGIVNLRPIVDQRVFLPISLSLPMPTSRNPANGDVGVCIDVLVIPKRLAPRLADLSQEEITDLFLSVQTIGRRIEQATDAKSLTVACQDGPFAGVWPASMISCTERALADSAVPRCRPVCPTCACPHPPETSWRFRAG